MDQAFSVKNLLLLLKEDREKGGDLEEKYIPEAFKVRLKIYKLKRLRSFLRYQLRLGRMTEAVYLQRTIRINSVLEKRKIQHEGLINFELDLVYKAINKKDFKVEVNLLPSTVGGKKVYGIGESLQQILAVRFIQRTLGFIYKIKMPSRDILVSQVKTLALDRMPKYIIRADVEQFYESVRHKDLLDNIHQSADLSITVKRILTRLIKDYVSASGNDKGLPRGIGMSAYLSEIYLAEIDKSLKRQEDLFYYARYVDDIVLMYAPKRKEVINTYLPNLREILKNKGLSLNDKTRCLDVIEEQKGKFEYLGYEFDLAPSTRGVRLSSRKFEKYRSRIEKSFADYQEKILFISDKAAEELIVRCLFLTGNIRLFNRKSNAFIGVYFSNKFITEIAQLKGLDRYFQHKVSTLTCPSLKRKLAKLSFETGFNDKIFRNFDSEKLSNISRGWNHG